MTKLQIIQQELKAPKNNYNSFGKFNYRSCEDILEAVKPLLKENDCILTLSDEIVQVGDRYYIKATANLSDIETGDSYSVTAYAREAENKSGMDASQITGTASSYARKYALNGLFLIDDTKDADTDEYKKQTDKKVIRSAGDTISTQEASILKTMLQDTNSDVKKFCEYFKVSSVDEIKVKDYADACKMLNDKAKNNEVNIAG